MKMMMIFRCRFLRVDFVFPMLLVCFLLFSSIFGQEKLVWEDNFNGNSLNLSKWRYDEQDGCQYGVDLCGWGNNELQWYQKDNAKVCNGVLKIEARKEDVAGKAYTSSKLLTKKKGDWTFGRVEVRAKLPKGQGIWPAIWMLPTDEEFGKWPRSGEIDIMESRGQTPQTVGMTAHYGSAWNDKSQKGMEFTLPSGTFADDFHVFSIDWKQDRVTWLIDGVEQMTLVPDDVGHYQYPFNKRFYLVLNVAVGGNYLGSPDSSTQFPTSMEVDYVRVYQ